MGEEQIQKAEQNTVGFAYEPLPSLHVEQVTGGFVITGWSPKERRLHAVAGNKKALARVVLAWANGLDADG